MKPTRGSVMPQRPRRLTAVERAEMRRIVDSLTDAEVEQLRRWAEARKGAGR